MGSSWQSPMSPPKNHTGLQNACYLGISELFDVYLFFFSPRLLQWMKQYKLSRSYIRSHHVIELEHLKVNLL